MAEEQKPQQQKQNTPVKTPRRSISLALLTLAVLALSSLGDNGVLQLMEVADYRGELEERKGTLARENERLQAELHALQHDDHYIEQVARGTLSLVREGETVYQFKQTER
ncbi:MAG: FtsB family cell division protein [Thermodesulfobacteriota bacterium]